MSLVVHFDELKAAGVTGRRRFSVRARRSGLYPASSACLARADDPLGSARRASASPLLPDHFQALQHLRDCKSACGCLLGQCQQTRLDHTQVDGLVVTASAVCAQVFVRHHSSPWRDRTRPCQPCDHRLPTRKLFPHSGPATHQHAAVCASCRAAKRKSDGRFRSGLRLARDRRGHGGKAVCAKALGRELLGATQGIGRGNRDCAHLITGMRERMTKILPSCGSWSKGVHSPMPFQEGCG